MSNSYYVDRCGCIQALGSWLSAYTHMGVKAYQSQHSSRQPTADQSAGLLTSHEAAGRTTHQSNALFSWLFKACLAYQLYDWLRVRFLLKALACSKPLQFLQSLRAGAECFVQFIFCTV